MSIPPDTTRFASINAGYNRTFTANRLSLGLVVPLERYDQGPVPAMQDHLTRIQLAEKLGFATIWLRDVPFNVPSFGDAGQIFDPFVYLGLLAGQTQKIALGIASVVLPLRHPAHVAKALASVDQLSGGRLLAGIASGDRPEEYPALNMTFDDRSMRFRESYEYIRQMSQPAAEFSNHFGSPSQGMDMLPKPVAGTLPLLITGGSQQSPEWIAQHGDGWMLYPRGLSVQAEIIRSWRERTLANGRLVQPAMQPLYIDLLEDPDAPAQPIHLGVRCGIHYLRGYLKSLEEIGINHVALNLRFNQADTESTLRTLAEEILPHFSKPSCLERTACTKPS